METGPFRFQHMQLNPSRRRSRLGANSGKEYSALLRLAPETWSRLAGLILGPPNHSGANNFENEGTLFFERVDQGIAGGSNHIPDATGILADEVGS